MAISKIVGGDVKALLEISQESVGIETELPLLSLDIAATDLEPDRL